MVTRPGLMVALDVKTAEEAVRTARSLVDHADAFKVGLGLLMGPGPGTVSALARLDKPVFADAKLHDIPSQVEAAARRLGRHGARWITAHVSGGQAMLEAAVSGLRDGAGSAPAGILGVTVLTSLDEAALHRVGIPRRPGELVSRMARVAAGAGCEGVVCSVGELGVVAAVAPQLATVTPGIRLEPGPADDQARVATPEEAARRGATYVVVGRAITRAPDPAAAAAEVVRRLAVGSEGAE